MKVSEAREMIRSGLEASLDDVTIWPYLMADLPDTPAAVIRRIAAPAVVVQGAGGFPHFDVIAIVDMATPERVDDLDGLVESIEAALGRINGVDVRSTGDEEEFMIAGQSKLGIPITVAVYIATV